jgi:hypothetical protein
MQKGVEKIILNVFELFTAKTTNHITEKQPNMHTCVTIKSRSLKNFSAA